MEYGSIIAPTVPIPDFEDAYNTQRVLEASLISAEEGDGKKAAKSIEFELLPGHAQGVFIIQSIMVADPGSPCVYIGTAEFLG